MLIFLIIVLILGAVLMSVGRMFQSSGAATTEYDCWADEKSFRFGVLFHCTWMLGSQKVGARPLKTFKLISRSLKSTHGMR